MIAYILLGHALENEVQTTIQIFYPNLHYQRVESLDSQTGICIVSEWKEGLAVARLFSDGAEVSSYIKEQHFDCTEKEKKLVVKETIYRLLAEELQLFPKWGFFTGVRPAKLMSYRLRQGMAEADCLNYMKNTYDMIEGKAKLSLEVAKAELSILERSKEVDVSIYIGIPFCPTRCVYCSFASYPLQQYANRVDAYLLALQKEMQYVSTYLKEHPDLNLQTVYIGGGTPTALDESQFEQLLLWISELFPLKKVEEFTVEAGRPDTITAEKLRLMKMFGVNRISINPQTMNDKTLQLIGRTHSVADTIQVFHLARELGHDNINMDLILGLPDETLHEVKHTLAEIEKLSPESVTIHTLTVKRASRLKEELSAHKLTKMEQMEEMLAVADLSARKMGMKPYYMYRQKNTVGNFENVGYCRHNRESVYNIQIMEEKQMIFGIGAGASTKLLDFATDRIERVFNVKSVDDYIARVDEMIDRKKDEFLKMEDIKK
ncbi:MAG: coproporphyrinogen dehydrogenase HemZ [Bacillota bacterium]